MIASSHEINSACQPKGWRTFIIYECKDNEKKQKAKDFTKKYRFSCDNLRETDYSDVSEKACALLLGK